MVDLLIHLLQSLKKKDTSKFSFDWFRQFLSMAFGVLLVVGPALFLIIENGFSLQGHSIWLLLIGLAIMLIGVLSIFAVVKCYREEGSFYDFFYRLCLPLGSVIFFLYFVRLATNYGLDFGPLTGVFELGLLLLVIHPILVFLYSLFSKRPLQDILKHSLIVFFYYNIGVLFFMGVLSTYIIFGDIDWIQEMNRKSGLQIIIYFISLLFLSTYSLISLRKLLTLIGRKVALLKGILFALVGYVLIFVTMSFPGWVDWYYDNLLYDKVEQLHSEGHTYETYADIKSWLIPQAVKWNFKRGKLKSAHRNLFSLVYDTTPEDYFAGKFSVDENNRRTNATNASFVGEKAKVVLKLMEIENTIVENDDEMAVLETTYAFHLENETTDNQEVIVTFETPDQWSVVTDLKLGLNGQFSGVIAPRGAAKKVYQDSLRVNKDPALIEKVGMSTYLLRIFPIPAKNDEATQGRQIVQLSLHSPIESDSDFIYAPKFSFINAKTTKNSSLVAKVYNGSELLQEDVVRDKEMESYLETEHVLPSTELPTDLKQMSDYCIPEYLTRLTGGRTALQGVLDAHSEIGGKISIFFDASESARRNELDSMYRSVYASLKNYDGKLQDVNVYAHNFRVEKLAEVDDILYWGYSDIDSVLNYIVENEIINQHIILVTDDESFNYTENENKDRKLRGLLSNKVSIIKIGSVTKRYKSDVTSIISASQGNVYELTDTTQIDELLAKVMSSDALNMEICGNGEETDSSGNDDGEQAVLPLVEEDVSPNENKLIDESISLLKEILLMSNNDTSVDTIEDTSDGLPLEEVRFTNPDKIIAGYVGSLLLGAVEDQKDWESVATLQTRIATSYHIVNQFNSMIALENERQARDLERYSNQNGKYDSDFENFDVGAGAREVGNPWIGFKSSGGAGLEMMGSSAVGGRVAADDLFSTSWDSRSQNTPMGAGFAGGGGGFMGDAASPYYQEESYNDINLVGSSNGSRSKSRGEIDTTGMIMLLAATLYLANARQLLLLCMFLLKKSDVDQPEQVDYEEKSTVEK